MHAVGRAVPRRPGKAFLIVASRAAPCESRLYRFRLTDSGEVTGMSLLAGGAVPALVGGLAMSPDGRKVA